MQHYSFDDFRLEVREALTEGDFIFRDAIQYFCQVDTKRHLFLIVQGNSASKRVEFQNLGEGLSEEWEGVKTSFKGTPNPTQAK